MYIFGLPRIASNESLYTGSPSSPFVKKAMCQMSPIELWLSIFFALANLPSNSKKENSNASSSSHGRK